MSTAYARTGHPDSARATASRIPREALDEATWNFLYYDIALSEDDPESALGYLATGHRIGDSTLAAGYGLRSRETL